MAEQEFSDEERAAAYEYARRQIAEANAPGVTGLGLDPDQHDGKTAALSVLPPEIADLGELTALGLRGTRISDLAPLQAMTGLQGLTLDNTQVADLAPLQAMTGLQTLRLGNTQVADLAPLRALAGLQELYLNNTQVADLAPLQAMTALQTLSLSNTQVASLAPLQAMTGLQRLSLNGTQVADLAPLQAMTGLQWLDLDRTQVTDLAPLQAMTGLQTIWLNDTRVADLAPLQALTGLQRLWLNDTKVADLTPLQAMTGLQVLHLNNTQVADLAPLQAMTGLQELRLEATQVADLAPLQAMTELQLLDLDDTQVANLSPLRAMTELQTLYLNDTRVADLLPLAGLSKLGERTYGGLWFSDTPAADHDDAHRALAAIEDGQDRAKQVLQYLNGEHPEFGGPPEPYASANPESPQTEPESSGPMPEIEWEKQDPYGLSFAMTGHLLALNFSASEPAPLAQQILPELREALRQLLEKLRGANFGIRQELFAEAELMAQMVAADIEEIEGQAVLLWFKSINLGSFIDRDEMARSDGRHDDDLLSAEHLSSLRRVVRASAPFVREFPEARKLDEAHRERKIDSFDPDRLFSVIERAVQAFVLEADAAGVLKQAVEIGSGSGDEATRARTVAGVSENNFWTIVARAAANYGKYAALVVGSATVMVTEGALNKVGSDLADHYRLSHSAVQLLQTIPDALLRSDDRPEDVKQTLMDAKVSIRDVKLPPIPSRRPLAPFEAPAPPKRP